MSGRRTTAPAICALLLTALPSCSRAPPQVGPDRVGCVRFKAPEGWTRSPMAEHESLRGWILRAPAPNPGTGDHPEFRVWAGRTSDRTNREYFGESLEKWTSEAEASCGPSERASVPTVTDLSLDGVPALLARSVLTSTTEPPRIEVHRNILTIVHAGFGHTVAAIYEVPAGAPDEVAATAEKFLSSVRIRCD